MRSLGDVSISEVFETPNFGPEQNMAMIRIQAQANGEAVTPETIAKIKGALMRGFTSVRDLGGPSFGLKLAIDRGVVAGPRIWPSGAMISQTGSHGDFRMLSEIPTTPDEVRKRSRKQLLQGASQIKLTVGGGVSSPYGPLDTVQLSVGEIRAAVEAAENWGTTLCAFQRALKTLCNQLFHALICAG